MGVRCGDLWCSDPPTSTLIYNPKQYAWRLGILMTSSPCKPHMNENLLALSV